MTPKQNRRYTYVAMIILAIILIVAIAIGLNR